MLFLVATPIGNLSDITFRALETLKISDYILCEDTRHSATLLNHYQIQKPLKSYHKFNETAQLDKVLEDLESGMKISLISDAGTPGISDPGSILVQECINRKIDVISIPGPCAAIQALSCSGLSTERFQFCGFLPRKENELKLEIYSLLNYQGTTICYESPLRLLSILKLINEIDPKRKLVVARELTKKYEEIVRGTPLDLITHWEGAVVKGEVVLLISPTSQEPEQDWSQWSPSEHVEWIEKTYLLNRKEAIKLVAQLRGIPKRQLYHDVHEL